MDTLKKENAVKLVEMRDEINQLKGENELLTGLIKLSNFFLLFIAIIVCYCCFR